MSEIEKYLANLDKQAKDVKPVEEISQTVLWIKEMGLRSPHFKSVKEGKPIVSEWFLNQMMQAAYNYGTANIEKRSYDAGYAAHHREIAEKLGFKDEE